MIPFTAMSSLEPSECLLENDLSRLIRDQFDKNKVSYKRSMCLERLTARYFEMATRRIQPVPRDVHFSEQIHTSLGELARAGKNNSAAQTDWGMVFGLANTSSTA